ncbi:MAG: putative glycoside hydrolase, partial [Candidatus Thermoplasmatota archaeon]
MHLKPLVTFVLLLAPAILGVGAAPAAAATAGFAWGSDLSQWGSYVDADRNAAISVSVATGMNTIVTDAKDGGPVGWASTTYPTVTRFAAGDGGVERVTRDAHAKGLKVAARFDVFEDSGAAAKYQYASLGGSPVWVDPGCAEVRAYALAQVKELVKLVPIDELAFDHVRYPDGSESYKTSLPCTASGADRSAIITSWVKDAAAAARAIRPGIVVSVSVFAYTMKGPIPAIGQDASLLAPHVDILRPMIYPVYISSTALADPYTAAKSWTSAGVQKFGGAKIQPWIQGFGTYSTRPDLVCAQYKGLADAGASGGIVWWFPSTGTTHTFWDKVSPCVPTSAPPTTTTPTTNTTATPTSGFPVTFSPNAGNNWWVETQATSALAIAGVSASVNGGSPVALAKSSWGTWTKSFY